MQFRIVACLMLCAGVAGCAGFNGVMAGQRSEVGDGVSVQSGTAWASAYGPAVSGYLWTIDGFSLNELRFVNGITAGKPLMQIPGVTARELGTYSGDMLPNDIMDLVSSTLAKAGNLQVETAALRPAPFGSVMGFRFDLSYVTKDGLQMKGTALFAQRAKKLDLILFDAPAEYYYDHNLPMVEQVFASIRLPGNA